MLCIRWLHVPAVQTLVLLLQGSISKLPPTALACPIYWHCGHCQANSFVSAFSPIVQRIQNLNLLQNLALHIWIHKVKKLLIYSAAVVVEQIQFTSVYCMRRTCF